MRTLGSPSHWLAAAFRMSTPGIDTNDLTRVAHRPRQLDGQVSQPAPNIHDGLARPGSENLQSGEATLNNIRPTVGVLKQAAGVCVELQHDYRSCGFTGAARMSASSRAHSWPSFLPKKKRPGGRSGNRWPAMWGRKAAGRLSTANYEVSSFRTPDA